MYMHACVYVCLRMCTHTQVAVSICSRLCESIPKSSVPWHGSRICELELAAEAAETQQVGRNSWVCIQRQLPWVS